MAWQNREWLYIVGYFLRVFNHLAWLPLIHKRARYVALQLNLPKSVFQPYGTRISSNYAEEKLWGIPREKQVLLQWADNYVTKQLCIYAHCNSHCPHKFAVLHLRVSIARPEFIHWLLILNFFLCEVGPGEVSSGCLTTEKTALSFPWEHVSKSRKIKEDFLNIT